MEDFIHIRETLGPGLGNRLDLGQRAGRRELISDRFPSAAFRALGGGQCPTLPVAAGHRERDAEASGRSVDLGRGQPVQFEYRFVVIGGSGSWIVHRIRYTGSALFDFAVSMSGDHRRRRCPGGSSGALRDGGWRTTTSYNWTVRPARSVRARIGSSAVTTSHRVASSPAVMLAAVTDTSARGVRPWPCCSWCCSCPAVSELSRCPTIRREGAAAG